MAERTSTEALGRLAALVREGGRDLSRPVEEMARAAGGDFSFLLMVSPSEGKTWLIEGFGLKNDPGERPADLASSYLFRQVTLSANAPYHQVKHGWEQDPFLTGEGPAGLLLHVHHADGLHFALVVGRRGKGGFDARTGELFGVLAQFLCLAAERSFLQAEVQRWRDRDPLTGLPVYHSFYEIMRREVSRARRQGGKLSLALLSVEGLEGVSQRKGRGAADAILKKLAGQLKENIRDNDIAGRYGPSEFGLLLTEVNGVIGRMVADRLLRGVTEGLAGGDPEVSFRMGFAGYPDEATTTERLIETCEGALALARQSQSPKAVRWKRS